MTLEDARPWLVPAAALLAVHAVVSLTVHQGFAAAVFSDVLQSVLLLVFFLLTVYNARAARGRARFFWGSMAVAAGLWLAGTLCWLWFEVVLREEVPLTFIGDVLFFLHIVPMMAALATRPHRPERSKRLEFGAADYILLLLWWVYLYLAIVIPWQYVYADSNRYSSSFVLLYAIENVILLAMLLSLCLRARGDWREIYSALLVAAALYTGGSQLANWAIVRRAYYTGSVYDLPLIGAMVIFIGVAWMACRKPPKPMQEPGSRLQGVLASRLAMVAVLSLPLMGVWAIYAPTPESVKSFRFIATLGALLVLPFLVFLKQHLLDRELVRLWSESQRNFENLKRLQEQLVQAEKLASLGQLISGAAHEINNPLTAIIGYSDLLAEGDGVADAKKPFVTKIKQQAHRVREVVANLRSFAKQIPGKKKLVDINPLLTDAMELCTLDLSDETIRIERDLAPGLPQVLGDPNGLLQVGFHVISNAIDAVREVGGGVVRVSSRRQDGSIVVEVVDTGPGVRDPLRIFDPFYSTKPIGKGPGLGLSACYGIVRDHRGEITCENLGGGGARFAILLPVAEPEPTTKSATAEA